MKIYELEKIKGILSTIHVLYKDGATISSRLIEKIPESRDTFYRLIKELQDQGIVTRNIKKITDYGIKKDMMVWDLTDKGRKIAKLLDKIDRLL